MAQPKNRRCSLQECRTFWLTALRVSPWPWPPNAHRTTWVRSSTRFLAIIAEQYENGEVVDLKRLLELVPGPDFPTGGLICGTNGVVSAYSKGRGSIKVRAVCRITETKRVVHRSLWMKSLSGEQGAFA